MKIYGKAFVYKSVSILLVLGLTIFIGFSYVAPRVILKLSRNISRSTAADYGMRYDDCLVVSEDSLELKGDFIFPFDLEYGEKYGNHSLIVLHEITGNTKSIYPFIKSMITLNVNFISFDSRGHGRSEGHLYTMGLKEAEDITKIIDSFVEKNPDHSFGIYARGNSANVALKAMENDKRIQYGIVENYFPSTEEHLRYLHYDDVLYNSEMVSSLILDNTLNYLETTRDEVTIHTKDITQPILMLSSPGNYRNMALLYDTVSSQNKYLIPFDENVFYAFKMRKNDELYECVTEFIEMYSEEARLQILEKVFVPS